MQSPELKGLLIGISLRFQKSMSQKSPEHKQGEHLIYLFLDTVLRENCSDTVVYELLNSCKEVTTAK